LVVEVDSISNAIVVDCFNSSNFNIVTDKILIEVVPGTMLMCRDELNIKNDSAQLDMIIIEGDLNIR
jgi:hypothetical protein